jgi:hypothetical protein
MQPKNDSTGTLPPVAKAFLLSAPKALEQANRELPYYRPSFNTAWQFAAAVST